MESILSNFDIENRKNFWKLYPSFKTPKVYQELYKNDKSKGKVRSSDIMWTLTHLYDKHEANPYRSMDWQDRIEVVNLDVLDKMDFDWDKHSEIMELTSKIFQTEEMRELESFKEFMSKRRRLIVESEDKMDLETLKSLDDARKRNKENLNELQRLEDICSLKADSGTGKGGLIESAKEKGLL